MYYFCIHTYSQFFLHTNIGILKSGGSAASGGSEAIGGSKANGGGECAVIK